MMLVDPNPENLVTILFVAVVAILGTVIVAAVRWHDRRAGRLSRIKVEERRLRCVRQQQ